MSTGGTNRRVEMETVVICYRRKQGIKSASLRSMCCCSGTSCLVIPKRRKSRALPLFGFLRDLKDRAVTALCMVSLREKPSPMICSMAKSTPSSDYHMNESVEACIQYINSYYSSSSSPQSKSNPSIALSKSG
ncbi:hypothetical protein SAY87_020425 [Trapa incisa]|uniref:Josephin-like protein n=2 Tax=Trapa TaxID=22665 RepID=A0AAN7R8J1_TRANT|nr:hypothetical protein SAY87_020425 [Trapa incisa]KAK4792170.1 hypothetical protein SAY86_022605 [Trapa natans]